MPSNKKFAIIDTFALLHRAWHAIPNLTTKDGTMVNAVYGFTAILLKLLKDLKPDYIVAAFDLPHETFRKKEYKEYKAQREAPEKDFVDQIALTENILRALEVPILAKPGYEADDIIGSLATQLHAEQKDMDILIVSGDLDTLQLVNGRTKIYTLRKGINDTIYYDEGAVRDRYGLKPKQIIDMKGLAGDPSDNIPGVKGIGIKGACDLLKEFGSIENIYEHLDSPKIKPRTRELLREQKKEAELSKHLATIVTDLKIQLDIDKARADRYDLNKAMKIFQELEFRSLLAKLPTSNGTEERPAVSKKTQQKYEVISTESGIRDLAGILSKAKEFALDTETEGLDFLHDKILGASFAIATGKAWFVHLRTDAQRVAFGKYIGPILENERIGKIGHNIKFDYEVLQHLGVKVQGLSFDTLVAAYLLQPNRGLKIEELAFSYLGVRMQTLHELAADQLEGKKKSARSRSETSRKKDIDVTAIDPDKLAQYGAADADMAYRLYVKLAKQLRAEKLDTLLRDIEMPLIPVLARMETTGILIDAEYLRKKEKELKKDIVVLEKKIYKLAGTEFNIASPLQLKQILFEKLDLATKGIKRKKTGLSTAADELEKLKDLHPIIPRILDYREITKLVNTYVSTLPDMADRTDKRIHTNYNQTIAATGRLSSTDPNLQNIPIRTELGRTIRQAFIAARGYRLVSADYSQIELRLAAVISKDPKMLASFKKGEDIHRRTAAEINRVALDEVTPDQRRNAKEVNFGVIYGLGSTGLAQRTGMSRLEAKEFIAKYFELYKKVKEYIDTTKSFAHEHGYVVTLFGRKRKLPEIYSSAPMLVAQAERMAVNMPLQGTAADLMKLAMIRSYDEIQKAHPETRMLLQVHDELVFEVPADEVEKTARLIKKTMESVARYDIPLAVEIKTGQNWADMDKVEL
ncbi:MAG: DNA polymerase I [Candidatus Komeilibacteria bacterium]|nr:DNA polymerase I [Candidatus Komeilibacteria bacterium]